MTLQRHRFFRFLFIPLLILAVLLGLVLFQQHAGLPASLSTQSNTPWNLILVNNEHALPQRILTGTDDTFQRCTGGFPHLP